MCSKYLPFLLAFLFLPGQQLFQLLIGQRLRAAEVHRAACDGVHCLVRQLFQGFMVRVAVKEAAAAGIDYDALCEMIVQDAPK